MSLSVRIDNSSFRKKLRDQIPIVQDRAVRVIELVQREAVDYAKSYTNETKPETRLASGRYVRKENQGTRKLHPGGWGDVTFNLRDSIQEGKIQVTKTQVRTEFGVTTNAGIEYAEILDQRDGIDVLGGADVVARKSLQKHGKEIIS